MSGTFYAKPMDLSTVDEKVRTRFEGFVQRGEGCWTWNARVDRQGYGRFTMGRAKHGAHRISYALYVGPILEGLTIDHLCFNTRCVNPSHLEQVSNGENVRRANLHADPASECKRGHAFVEGNIDRQGTRRKCRTCRNARRPALRRGISVDQYLATRSP